PRFLGRSSPLPVRWQGRQKRLPLAAEAARSRHGLRHDRSRALTKSRVATKTLKSRRVRREAEEHPSVPRAGFSSLPNTSEKLAPEFQYRAAPEGPSAETVGQTHAESFATVHGAWLRQRPEVYSFAPSSVAFSRHHSKRSNFTSEIRRSIRSEGSDVGTGSTNANSIRLWPRF